MKIIQANIGLDLDDLNLFEKLGHPENDGMPELSGKAFEKACRAFEKRQTQFLTEYAKDWVSKNMLPCWEFDCLNSDFGCYDQFNFFVVLKKG